MRLLDLFSGAGGAAWGYHLAGFTEIVGVDIVPQPNYPFDFVRADALNPPVDLGAFDLVHASPPCQAYSNISPQTTEYPDLVAPTQRLLADRPHVIENVPGAPLNGYLRLCGSMFNTDIQRHRYFEMTFPAWSPPCSHNWAEGRPWTVTGELKATIDDRYQHSFKPSLVRAQTLMGIDWMTRHEITEAIPPAYTRFIGEQFIAQARNRPEAESR